MRAKRSRLVLPKKEYKKLCDRVHQRDGWRCKVPWCKAREQLNAHHITFRSQGGDDASYNMITMCKRCHQALHDRYIIIRPLRDGQEINADEGVKWEFVNGWFPNRRQ